MSLKYEVLPNPGDGAGATQSRGGPVGVGFRRKVDVRLPGKGNSNSHGARPVHLIITMIKWIRTSRLSKKISLLSSKGRDRRALVGTEGRERLVEGGQPVSVDVVVAHLQFRGGLVFKAHRHSTLSLRVIKKNRPTRTPSPFRALPEQNAVFAAEDPNTGLWVLGFRVQGSGFRVQGSGFGVRGSGFRV